MQSLDVKLKIFDRNAGALRQHKAKYPEREVKLDFLHSPLESRVLSAAGVEARSVAGYGNASVNCHLGPGNCVHCSTCGVPVSWWACESCVLRPLATCAGQPQQARKSDSV